ncbi:MAG: hypothetical protein COB22_08125 [Cycloclasticus sp.]|nr:MAG: hypothetical protein COB22_08125 [Cycloclasticus sp.]
MEGFLIFGFILVVLAKFYWDDRQEKKIARTILVAELIEQSQKADSLCQKAITSKTAAAKRKYSLLAIEILDEIKIHPETRELVSSFDESYEKIKTLAKLAAVFEAIDKADKHKFKGNEKSELGALQDALYEIQNNDIRNKDFIILVPHPEEGELNSIESIEERCKELGWERKQ